MFDRKNAPAIGFIQLGQLIGDPGLFPSQLLFERVTDLVGIDPVQPGIGEAKHAKVLQGAELINLLDQGVVVVGRCCVWCGKIHNGRDQRQQRS